MYRSRREWNTYRRHRTNLFRNNCDSIRRTRSYRRHLPLRSIAGRGCSNRCRIRRVASRWIRRRIDRCRRICPSELEGCALGWRIEEQWPIGYWSSLYRVMLKVVTDETSFSPIETSMRLLALYVLSPSRQGIWDPPDETVIETSYSTWRLFEVCHIHIRRK
jgi:hypothetical protein